MATEPKNKIGPHIRAIRKRLGITVNDASHLCGGLCYRTVTQIEGQRRKCSENDLQWILHWFYDVRKDDLITAIKEYMETDPMTAGFLMAQSILAKQYCTGKAAMTEEEKETERQALAKELDACVQSGEDIFHGIARDEKGRFTTYSATDNDIWL